MLNIGFRPTHPRAYRIYNISVGVALLLATLPFVAIISLLLLATQGASIIYRGRRIGCDDTTFEILKFRTLCSIRAEALTRNQALPADADIFTPMGRFLRDTRLDELPQLLNVIRGDMNICGPRPVRAEIRNLHSTLIPGYDTRFEVRPGLLGPTQAYFGHGASKRLRAKMNNAAVRRPVDIRAELALIARIMSAMVVKLVLSVAPSSAKSMLRSGGRADIYLLGGPGDDNLPVVRMTNWELVVHGGSPSEGEQTIAIRMTSGGIRRAKIDLRPGRTSGTYRFEPANDLSAYVVERYALGKAVLTPAVHRVPVEAAASGPLMVSGARA